MLTDRTQNIKLLLYVAILCGVASFGMAKSVYAIDVTTKRLELLQSMMQRRDFSLSLGLISSLSPEMQQRFDIRFYKATSLAGVGKNGEAMDLFKILIEERPTYPALYNNLAMLMVNDGKLLKAQQALEQGLRSDESYATLYNNLSIVFETMARRSYAKALIIKGEQSPMLTSLVTLEGFSAPLQTEADDTGVAALNTDVNGESKSVSNRQIEDRLHNWANRWQKKDIEGYIASYSPNFKSRGYPTHQAWMKGRSEKIGRTRTIEISIEEVAIEPLSLNRIKVDFIMDYYSDHYSDRSKKRLIFKQIDGRWHIVRELTLEVINS
ncbi:MAG: hypothetical protein GQ470_06270 [Gammaproteobacteria bacterium]|nr:hypothetical protein [Gammaproteobacteria bacterium]